LFLQTHLVSLSLVSSMTTWSWLLQSRAACVMWCSEELSKKGRSETSSDFKASLTTFAKLPRDVAALIAGFVVSQGHGNDGICAKPLRKPLSCAQIAGQTHTSTIFALAVNSSMLASAGADRRIIFWDVTTREPNDTAVRGPGVARAQLSLRKTVPASTASKEEQEEHGHTHWVTSLAAVYVPRPLLVSGSLDATLRLWDWESASPVALLHVSGDDAGNKKSRNSGVKCLAPLIGCGNCHLASGGVDARVRLWDLRELCEAGVLMGHTNVVTALQSFTDVRTKTRCLASASLDGRVLLWNVKTRCLVAVLRQRPVSRPVSALAAFQNGHGNTVLVSGCQRPAPPSGTGRAPSGLRTDGGGAVALWDVSSLLASHAAGDSENGGPFDRTVEPIATYSGTKNRVAALATFTGPHGAPCALVGYEGAGPIDILDFSPGAESRSTLQEQDDSVRCAMGFIGPNKTLVFASAGTDTTVRLWCET
jgi:WD40 repeat protein